MFTLFQRLTCSRVNATVEGVIGLFGRGSSLIFESLEIVGAVRSRATLLPSPETAADVRPVSVGLDLPPEPLLAPPAIVTFALVPSRLRTAEQVHARCLLGLLQSTCGFRCRSTARIALPDGERPRLDFAGGSGGLLLLGRRPVLLSTCLRLHRREHHLILRGS